MTFNFACKLILDTNFDETAVVPDKKISSLQLILIYGHQNIS